MRTSRDRSDSQSSSPGTPRSGIAIFADLETALKKTLVGSQESVLLSKTNIVKIFAQLFELDAKNKAKLRDGMKDAIARNTLSISVLMKLIQLLRLDRDVKGSLAGFNIHDDVLEDFLQRIEKTTYPFQLKMAFEIETAVSPSTFILFSQMLNRDGTVTLETITGINKFRNPEGGPIDIDATIEYFKNSIIDMTARVSHASSGLPIRRADSTRAVKDSPRTPGRTESPRRENTSLIKEALLGKARQFVVKSSPRATRKMDAPSSSSAPAPAPALKKSSKKHSIPALNIANLSMPSIWLSPPGPETASSESCKEYSDWSYNEDATISQSSSNEELSVSHRVPEITVSMSRSPSDISVAHACDVPTTSMSRSPSEISVHRVSEKEDAGSRRERFKDKTHTSRDLSGHFLIPARSQPMLVSPHLFAPKAELEKQDTKKEKQTRHKRRSGSPH